MKKTMILGLLLSLTLLMGCSKSNQITGNAVSDLQGEMIEIPLSEITNQVTKHTYEGVRFFVVRGSDGEVRTAFDACDVCGSKGYTQRGNNIVCNNCGQTFSIDGLGTQNKGYGCWPSYLSHRIEGDKVLINPKEVKP